MSYLIVALLLWVIWMLHNGLKVTIQLPDHLTQTGVTPVHHKQLRMLLCDEHGKLRTEVTTLSFPEFPSDYIYAGVSYSRHKISGKGSSAEYRPKKA